MAERDLLTFNEVFGGHPIRLTLQFCGGSIIGGSDWRSYLVVRGDLVLNDGGNSDTTLLSSRRRLDEHICAYKNRKAIVGSHVGRLLG